MTTPSAKSISAVLSDFYQPRHNVTLLVARITSWLLALLLGVLALMSNGRVNSAEPLTISNIKITPLDHGVTVTWVTDEAANSCITVRGSGFEVSTCDFGYITQHAATLIDDLQINPQISYQLIVRSTNRAGQIASVGPMPFVTAADVTPPVISAMRISNVASQSAVVTWESNEYKGDGYTDYGTDLNYSRMAQAFKDVKCPCGKPA